MSKEIYLQPQPKTDDKRFLVSSIVKLPEYPPHYHLNFEIAFVIKGHATHVINGVSFPWTKNRCAIIRPTDNHYFKDTTNHLPFSYEHKDIHVFNDNAKKICDAMSPDLYDKILNHPEPIEFFISDECIYSILNKIEQLRTSDNNTLSCALYTVIVSMLISQWLLDQTSKSQDIPEWITKLTTDLNDIDKLSMSVSDIAKKIGYSLPYFSRTFKQYMGETFISYITKKRMHFSLDLLKGGISIVDISNALGYSNPSTFCKHFHSEFGCPPNKYRQKEFKK